MDTVDFDPAMNVADSPSTMKAGGLTHAGLFFHLSIHGNLRLFCGSLNKEQVYFLTYTKNLKMTSSNRNLQPFNPAGWYKHTKKLSRV